VNKKRVWAYDITDGKGFKKYRVETLKSIYDEIQKINKNERCYYEVNNGDIPTKFKIDLDIKGIAGLSALQLTNLGAALARVGVPTTHKRLGLIPRFVDNAFYLANAGLINLLLFSKVRETPNTAQYNYDLMVLNFPAGINGMPAVKLSTMVSGLRRAMGPNRRYLDLHRGGIITRNQMRVAAGAIPGGFGSPDIDIQPAFQ